MQKKVIEPGKISNNPAGRPLKSKNGKSKPVLFTASPECQAVLSKLPANKGGGVKSEFISRAVVELWNKESGQS